MVTIKTETSRAVSQSSVTDISPKEQAKEFQQVEFFDEFLEPPRASTIKAAPLIKPVKNPPKTKWETAYKVAALAHRRPSITLRPVTESAIYSFNHTHEYAIEEGFLWYRDRGEQEWKPLYFDGFKKGCIPVSLTADGANLLVIDDKNQVNYKKILKEYRASEIDYEKDADCRAARDRIEGCPYVALDINETSKWEKKWFSLPVLHLVINAFRGRKLSIPPDALGFTISHRGRYNDYVEDKVGQRHPVGTGVTTGYVLANNGQDIPKKDPWSPKGAKTTIYLPETKDTVFVGQQIAASASTVAALGYETKLSTGEQELSALTRLGDIDTDGGNPFLKYGYFKDENDPDRRVLPTDNEWQKHPLRLQGQAFVTKSLTISQTGEGNKARMLTINGTNEEGKWGYYQKALRDTKWEFIQTDVKPQDTTPLSPPKQNPTSSTVHDYVGKLGECPAWIENFGLRSTHSKIRIDIGDKSFALDLYRRFSFANFLGIDKARYDLVIPEDNAELQQIFGKDKVLSVRVSQKGESVKIRSPVFTTRSFKFAFDRVDA